MAEKILVTGGAGYIGSLLCPMLLAEGYEVTILDNLKWGIKPILHFLAHPKCTLETGDVREAGLVRKLVEKHDIVLHLAAIVGYPACAADPILSRTTNVDGTRNVASAISPAQRLIYASTGSTYGKVAEICTEETPINPLSLYGQTKWEAENIALGVGGTALRFATVFGVAPRLRLDLLVNDFVYQAIHARQIVMYEGHFRRTFLHAQDAAQVYPFVLKNWDKMKGQAYNVGDASMNYTKREIAIEVKKRVDFYLHEAETGSDADARDYEVSYDKINRLGYKPKMNLALGIEELVRVLRHLYITNEWRNA